MRYHVLLFGLLGVAGSGYVSYLWGKEWLDERNKLPSDRASYEEKLSKPIADDSARDKLVKEGEDHNARAAEFYQRQRMLPFLLGSAVLGFIGTLMGFMGRGFSGALLLLVTGAGPSVVVVPQFRHLAGTISMQMVTFHGILSLQLLAGSLSIAGIFSLFVCSPPPAEADDMD